MILVTLSPDAFNNTPTLEAITPYRNSERCSIKIANNGSMKQKINEIENTFPSPLRTPPVTSTYEGPFDPSILIVCIYSLSVTGVSLVEKIGIKT